MERLHACSQIEICTIPVACYVSPIENKLEDVSALLFGNENTARAKFAVVFGADRHNLVPLMQHFKMKACLVRVEQLARSLQPSPDQRPLLRRFSSVSLQPRRYIRTTFIESPDSPPVLHSKYQLTKKERANIELQKHLLTRLSFCPSRNDQALELIRRIQYLHRSNLVLERFRTARVCTVVGLSDAGVALPQDDIPQLIHSSEQAM